MQRMENRYLIVAFSFIALIFVVAAVITIFYSSKIDTIKREQIELLEISLDIKRKNIEYEKREEKFKNIEEMFEENANIKVLLDGLPYSSKNLIVNSIPSGYPINSKEITSTFGDRIHPIYKKKKFHFGIDFGGKIGTPVVATADGIVEFAGYESGYGNFVKISHNFGFKTLYAHMLDRLKVKRGEFVKKGDIIGYLGNSGLSTGPHLHYGVNYIDSYLDPENFLKFSIDNFNSLFFSENRVAWESLVWAITSQYSKVGLARL